MSAAVRAARVQGSAGSASSTASHRASAGGQSALPRTSPHLQALQHSYRSVARTSTSNVVIVNSSSVLLFSVSFEVDENFALTGVRL